MIPIVNIAQEGGGLVSEVRENDNYGEGGRASQVAVYRSIKGKKKPRKARYVRKGGVLPRVAKKKEEDPSSSAQNVDGGETSPTKKNETSSPAARDGAASSPKAASSKEGKNNTEKQADRNKNGGTHKSEVKKIQEKEKISNPEDVRKGGALHKDVRKKEQKQGFSSQPTPEGGAALHEEKKADAKGGSGKEQTGRGKNAGKDTTKHASSAKGTKNTAKATGAPAGYKRTPSSKDGGVVKFKSLPKYAKKRAESKKTNAARNRLADSRAKIRKVAQHPVSHGAAFVTKKTAGGAAKLGTHMAVDVGSRSLRTGVAATGAALVRTGDAETDAVVAGSVTGGRKVYQAAKSVVKAPIKVRSQIRKRRYKAEVKTEKKIIQADKKLTPHGQQRESLRRTRMDLMQERKAGSPMSTNIRAVRLEKSVKNTRTKQAAFEKKINPALEKKENRVAELDKLMGKKDVKNTGSFKGKKPVYVGTRKKSEILSKAKGAASKMTEEREDGAERTRFNYASKVTKTAAKKASRGAADVTGKAVVGAAKLAGKAAEAVFESVIKFLFPILLPLLILIFLLYGLGNIGGPSDEIVRVAKGVENLTKEEQLIYAITYEDDDTRPEIVVKMGLYYTQIGYGEVPNLDSVYDERSIEVAKSVDNFKAFIDSGALRRIMSTCSVPMPQSEFSEEKVLFAWMDRIIEEAMKELEPDLYDLWITGLYEEDEENLPLWWDLWPSKVWAAQTQARSIAKRMKLEHVADPARVAELEAHTRNVMGFLFYDADPTIFNSGKNSPEYIREQLKKIQQTTNDYTDTNKYPPGKMPQSKAEMDKLMAKTMVPVRIAGKAVGEHTLYLGNDAYVAVESGGKRTLYKVVGNMLIEYHGQESSIPAENLTALRGDISVFGSNIRINGVNHKINNGYLYNPNNVVLQEQQFHYAMAGMYKSIFADISDSGIIVGYDGIGETYNYRTMNNPSSTTIQTDLSFHSYGIAFDLREDVAIQAADMLKSKYGMFWGGDWDQYDVYHFNIVDH